MKKCSICEDVVNYSNYSDYYVANDIADRIWETRDLIKELEDYLLKNKLCKEEKQRIQKEISDLIIDESELLDELEILEEKTKLAEKKEAEKKAKEKKIADKKKAEIDKKNKEAQKRMKEALDSTPDCLKDIADDLF